MALRDIRPYMLHAHIQWMDDSDEIPHIVMINGPGVVFPPHLREAPHLLFNVSSQACQGLDINDAGVSFSARFAGRVFKVECPLDAVASVQNKNATVMVSFAAPEQMEQSEETGIASPVEGASLAPAPKPRLTLVGEETSDETKPVEVPSSPGEAPARRGLYLVKGPGD